MKNSFMFLYCNPIEVVCFKQIKSCLLTENGYVIHTWQCLFCLRRWKLCLGYFAFSWTWL